MRNASQERTTEALSRIPVTESLTGIFVSQAGTLAKVNQGNSTIDVRSTSRTPLIPGESVRLERTPSGLVVTGPAVPRSALGRVAGTGTPTCTVEYPDGSGVTGQFTFPDWYTPTLNDIVALNWETGGSIEAKLTGIPAVNTPPTAGSSGPRLYHPPIIPASEAGSYRLGSWQFSTVIGSNTNNGCWAYGNAVKDIPDAAVIKSASIYLPLIEILGSETPMFGRHDLSSLSGAPSFSDVAGLEPRSGWVAIPTALITHLKANDGGLGFQAGYSYTIWAGLSDGLSGALDITYEL